MIWVTTMLKLYEYICYDFLETQWVCTTLFVGKLDLHIARWYISNNYNVKRNNCRILTVSCIKKKSIKFCIEKKTRRCKMLFDSNKNNEKLDRPQSLCAIAATSFCRYRWKMLEHWSNVEQSIICCAGKIVFHE